MYTLKRSFINKSSRKSFLYDDTYITNGHFLIRQDLVKDCYKWKEPSGMVDGNTIKHITDNLDKSKEFYKTGYLYDSKTKCLGLARIFGDSEGNYVAIQEDYYQAFNCDALFGVNNESPLVTSDGIILMPMKLPESFKSFVRMVA